MNVIESSSIASDIINSREFNIIIGNVLDTDFDLFFGPLKEDDTFIRFSNEFH